MQVIHLPVTNCLQEYINIGMELIILKLYYERGIARRDSGSAWYGLAEVVLGMNEKQNAGMQTAFQS